jgi:hypothetical protein
MKQQAGFETAITVHICVELWARQTSQLLRSVAKALSQFISPADMQL